MSAEISLAESLITGEFLKFITKYIGKEKVFFSKFSKAKELSTEDAIKKLNGYYRNEKLVLVLGAGISIAHGLPNWNTLMQKLITATINNMEKKDATHIARLFTDFYNPLPLITGRYLQKYFKDLTFEGTVRGILYEDHCIEKQSDLMNEIINFCVAPGKSPNLDCIITYNFDDIVEQRLDKLDISVPYFDCIFHNRRRKMIAIRRL